MGSLNVMFSNGVHSPIQGCRRQEQGALNYCILVGCEESIYHVITLRCGSCPTITTYAIWRPKSVQKIRIVILSRPLLKKCQKFSRGGGYFYAAPCGADLNATD